MKLKFSPIYQMLLLVLSVLSIVNISISILFNLSNDAKQLLIYTDNIICIFFGIDFIVEFIKAKSKLKFLKFGILDLISSIPALDVFRYGKMFRILHIIRLLRSIKSLRIIIKYVYKHKGESVLVLISLVTTILMFASSILIFDLEASVDASNIKTIEDAIWWSFVTITTVGYGDFYPVTTIGRILASILMIYGIGLFGTFTGLISSFIIRDNNEDKIEKMDKKINYLIGIIEEGKNG